MIYPVSVQIILASSNQHKLQELQSLFPDDRLVLPDSPFECEENGTTFIENALMKAMALRRLYPGSIIMADDSGLIVDALPGELGIHTARYGSEKAGRMLSASEKNALLLKNMEGLPKSARGARFVCALALIAGSHRTFIVEDSIEGRIVTQENGSHGFGYDPVFFLESHGCTMAQLSEEEKDKTSHRGRAAMKLRALMDTIRGEYR